MTFTHISPQSWREYYLPKDSVALILIKVGGLVAQNDLQYTMVLESFVIQARMKEIKSIN